MSYNVLEHYYITIFFPWKSDSVQDFYLEILLSLMNQKSKLTNLVFLLKTA